MSETTTTTTTHNNNHHNNHNNQVDKLEDVLKIVDLPVPEQEIDVHKISSLSRPPLRRALNVPQTAEQLVDVPLPAWMRLALGTDAAGRVWTCVWKQSTGIYWSLEGTRHTQWTRPDSPPAQSGISILGKAEADAGLWLSTSL